MRGFPCQDLLATDTGNPSSPAGPGAGQGPCRALVSHGKGGHDGWACPPSSSPSRVLAAGGFTPAIVQGGKSLGGELRQGHPQGQEHPLLLVLGSCPDPCGSSLAPAKDAACRDSCATGDLGHPLGSGASPLCFSLQDMLSFSPSQGFGAENGSFAKGAAVNVGVGLCTVGVPQAASPILVHRATRVLPRPQVLCPGTELFP